MSSAMAAMDPIRIMIIGEAPGKNEDEQGEPFVGKAGEILNEALAQAGLVREECYVTNVVKCRPHNNRIPTENEFAKCSIYLVREYKSFKPTHVLLLGSTPLKFLTSLRGIAKSRGYIPKHHSAFIKSDTYATYHPAATLYNADVKETFFKDISVFGKIVRSSYSALDQGDHERDVR